MKTKTKIGLILILVGIIIFVPVIVAYLIIHFPVNTFYVLLIVCGSIIYAGMIEIYEDSSQRGRGIMLNIIGIVVSFFTGMIIFPIDIWMDSLIVLIVIFTLLWFFIFNIPGLYKTIKKDNFPDLYKFLDLWASITTIFLIIFTIFIAVFQKQNFSEAYFPTLIWWILLSAFIGAIISGLIYLRFQHPFAF